MAKSKQVFNKVDLNLPTFEFDGNYLIFTDLDFIECYVMLSSLYTKYLVFCGSANLTVEYGSLLINEVIYDAPFTHDIFSTTSNMKLSISVPPTCHTNAINFPDYVNKMRIDHQCLKSAFKHILDGTNNNWILFSLKRLKTTTIDDVIQFKDFRKLFDVDRLFPNFRKTKFSLTVMNYSSVILDDETMSCVNNIVSMTEVEIKDEHPSTTVMMVGARNVGKSSLMRLLVNKLLRSQSPPSVFVLDADPGQTEFCPAGSVSLVRVVAPLLGPPFSHQLQTPHGATAEVLSLFLGLLSPQEDPYHYCRSLEHLHRAFIASLSSGRPHQRAVLIVNTMGWIEGLGAHCTGFLLCLVRPDAVVQLRVSATKTDMDLDQVLHSGAALHNFLLADRAVIRPSWRLFALSAPRRPQVQSEALEQVRVRPSHHRDLMSIAYIFHRLQDAPLSFPSASLPRQFHNNSTIRLQAKVRLSLNIVHEHDQLPSLGQDGRACVRLRLTQPDDTMSPCDLEMLCALARCSWIAVCRQLTPTHNSIVCHPKWNQIAAHQTPLYQCLAMAYVTDVRTGAHNYELDIITHLSAIEIHGCLLMLSTVEAPSCLMMSMAELPEPNKNSQHLFVSPLINLGAGHTSQPSKNSYPKIRRLEHN